MAMSTVVAWLILLVAMVTAARLLQFEPPRTVRLPWIDQPLPESCNARRVLGIDCPGCGLTRSFILSAHGEVRQALAIHPPGTVAFFFLCAMIPWRLWQAYRIGTGHRFPSTVTTEVMILLALLGVSIFWWAAKQASAYL
ncbi:DUF2752 domain-containing protein [Roseimaritima sediminicola]|uniref:DUF2752 domain-containing protein n=1 Tax=Roseimaritima sediminicola TaxID=2662066 RepID=UPI00192A5E79|nr:DUF2752 domain-containing protein [Roseimaritima sediminicola]